MSSQFSTFLQFYYKYYSFFTIADSALIFVDTYVIIYVDTEMRWIQLSPRTGRPTDNPKNLSTRIRMSDDDIKRLEFCCTKSGKTKAEIIRIGIQKVYDELKK